MCDCGIRGDRRLARPCHSALSAACRCSKSRATEAVEQCFYRNTPAVFQTLCEGFPRPAACSRAAWSPRCRSDPAGRSEDREGRSPCHRRPRDAMRQPPCRTCDITMHGRREVDPIGMSRSVRCAARDLRHVDAQIDACVFVRLSSRFTDTRASHRVQVPRACDVSMRMSKSYRSRVLVFVAKNFVRVVASTHRFFLRERALSAMSMHALTLMPDIARRARARFIVACICVAVNRHEHWVCGKRAFAGSNASTRSSGARKCPFAWSSDAHARSRLR